ncbi:MAG TPA: nuclease-related domain-containing protein [Candidatus Limnocylindrales bacterium]|nr:nuclease-related domain-containing protein [Candidatus Limnocylindrales bacterium]
MRSWGKGAVGEEALGAKLSALAEERRVILHDRRIPGSKANIDHLAVTPGGVYVIDAKHYSGRLQQRDLGRWFKTDLRLYVGRRDCTKLLHGSEDQAQVVCRSSATQQPRGHPARRTTRTACHDAWSRRRRHGRRHREFSL